MLLIAALVARGWASVVLKVWLYPSSGCLCEEGPFSSPS